MNNSTEWFSALLIFKMSGNGIFDKDKKIESIMVFKAKNFAEAHRVARRLGINRSDSESVKNKNGTVAIKLEFKYVQNVDIIGSEIESREVWSRLSDLEPGVIIESKDAPSQTI